MGCDQRAWRNPNNHVGLPPTIQAIGKFVLYRSDELGFTSVLCSEAMLAVSQDVLGEVSHDTACDHMLLEFAS